jgi:hypothetical protein
MIIIQGSLRAAVVVMDFVYKVLAAPADGVGRLDWGELSVVVESVKAFRAGCSWFLGVGELLSGWSVRIAPAESMKVF